LAYLKRSSIIGSWSVGYLLVDIAVLGPEDKIQVHDSAYIKNPVDYH